MPYRVEYAKTGRAYCHGPPCKKDKVKILKSTLRFGVWITIEEHGTWQWRHWGCVTPTQCANMATEFEGDPDLLDGYGDMNDEDKERIQKAIDDKHIADEELTDGLSAADNRDKETVKARKAAEKEAEKAAKRQAKADEKEAKGQSQKKKTRKARGVKNEEDDVSDDEVKKPVKTTKRSRVKEEDTGHAEEAGNTANARKRAKVNQEEDNDVETSIEKTKASSKTGKAVKKEVVDGSGIYEDIKPDISRPKKSKAKAEASQAPTRRSARNAKN